MFCFYFYQSLQTLNSSRQEKRKKKKYFQPEMRHNPLVHPRFLSEKGKEIGTRERGCQFRGLLLFCVSRMARQKTLCVHILLVQIVCARTLRLVTHFSAICFKQKPRVSINCSHVFLDYVTGLASVKPRGD